MKPAVAGSNHSQSQGADLELENAQAPPTGCTILLVAEHHDLVFDWTEALSLEGYRVYLTPEGREALAIVAATLPDLVISVYPRPVDGRTMVERIRSDRALKHLQVCALIPGGDPALAASAAAQGADLVIPTPQGSDLLVRQVRELLGRRDGSRYPRTKFADVIPLRAATASRAE